MEIETPGEQQASYFFEKVEKNAEDKTRVDTESPMKPSFRSQAISV